MVALISVIFKIKFSTSGVAHGDALLREELPQKKMFSFGHCLKRGGGEVIRAIPRRKHFFLQELFP